MNSKWFIRQVSVSMLYLSPAALWFVSLVLLVAPIKAQETIFTDEASGTRYTVEEYLPVYFLVGMAFAPDGRLFYNEKVTGAVRVIDPEGVLEPQPLVVLPTDALQERGMLGLALSPDFERDQYLYVVHTLEGTSRDFPANRLVRFTVDADNQAGEVEELWRVPIETGQLLHNGGNIHFDDEGYLYLSLGDYGEAANAQDLTTPQGAIHRFEITDDGLIPAADNPFGADNSIFAYGLRNPFDFTFDPFSDLIYASEAGENCDDEIDVIRPGLNYGWSEDYECVGEEGPIDAPDYAAPLLSFTPAITPTGLVVYEGDAFPDWQGDLFFCDWNFGTLRRVVLDESRSRALAVHEIDLGDATCRLDLVIGPDGGLYFGTVGISSASIMRLLPD